MSKRQSPNLKKKILTRAVLPTTTKTSSKNRGDKRCGTCLHLEKCEVFTKYELQKQKSYICLNLQWLPRLSTKIQFTVVPILKINGEDKTKQIASENWLIRVCKPKLNK